MRVYARMRICEQAMKLNMLGFKSVSFTLSCVAFLIHVAASVAFQDCSEG